VARGFSIPSPMTPEVRQLITQAGSKAQQAANQRMTHMLAYARGKQLPPQSVPSNAGGRRSNRRKKRMDVAIWGYSIE